MTKETATKPFKGDFKVGMEAILFFSDSDHVVKGKITGHSQTGEAVWFKPSVAYQLLGMRERRFTWRPSIKAFQEFGTKTKNGGGLRIIKKETA